MKPGQSPMYNLAQSVICETYPAGKETDIQLLLSSIEDEGADALMDYITPFLQTDTNFFLLVDQFEELFRFTSDSQDPEKKNEAIEFVNILLQLAQQSLLPVYIVITMRSDFIGDCAQFYGLPEAMNKSQYLVPRLSRTQLKNVITGPITVNGASIEQPLLNLLLNDAGDNPDQLPVLQHVLMRTWEEWQLRHTEAPVSVEDYLKTGTIASALSQHAEEAYEELGTDRLKYICEQLFKSITDKKQNARGVRRPQSFNNLLQLTGATEDELLLVINTFRQSGRTFLMPPDSVDITPKTIIDISHESLMRVWTRLIQWVDEESDSEQIYLRLSEAAILYRQEKGSLWRHPELDIALHWKDKYKPTAVWASQINNDFEAAMLFLEKSHQQSEQEIQERELEQRRQLKRARSFAVVIGLIAIASIASMIYAFNQRQLANTQAIIANESAKEAESNAYNAEIQKKRADSAYLSAETSRKEALIAKDSALIQRNRADSFYQITKRALLESKQSAFEAVKSKQRAELQEYIADSMNKRTQKVYKDMLDEADDAIRSRFAALRSKKTVDSITALANSRNYAMRALDELLQGNKNKAKLFASKAYEMHIGNRGPNQEDVLYNSLNEYWFDSIGNANQSLHNQHSVSCIASAPAGGFLFAADKNGDINTISYKENKLTPVTSKKFKTNIVGLAVSPDGKLLTAINERGKGMVYRVSAAGKLSEVGSFTPDGLGKAVLFENNNAFVARSGNSITVYEVGNKVEKKGKITDQLISSATVSATGKIYITRLDSLLVFNNSTDLLKRSPALVKPLFFSVVNNREPISSIAVDNSEQYIALGTAGGKIQLLNKQADGSWSTLLLSRIHQYSVIDLAFARVAGGSLQLASASADQTIKLIDVTSYVKQISNEANTRGGTSNLFVKRYQNKEEIITLQNHHNEVNGIAYSKDGNYLFSCGKDGKVIAWKPTMIDLYNALSW